MKKESQTLAMKSLKVGLCLKLEAQESSTNSVWYLDTRKSNHMCVDESFFSELAKVAIGFVSFQDDSK